MPDLLAASEVLRDHIIAAISKRPEKDLHQAFQQFSLDSDSFFPKSTLALASATGLALSLPEGERFQLEDWLEWEETVLRSSVYSSHNSGLDRLTSALSSSNFLVGQSITAADVAVFSTLFPLPHSFKVKLPEVVQLYLNRLQSLPAVKEGIDAAASSRQASVQQAETSQPGWRKPPILPVRGQRNLLVTSALPYVNNVPHLGNIIGSVLSADCYARFARSRGYNVIYICGTDEYGTATETKALQENLSCQEICDKYHAMHKEIYEWFGISFDHFGRTPTWQQTEICQEIFSSLQKNGYILEDTVEQLFSEALGKFLADRFVRGTCPKCRYEDAKGDQCDKCGAVLNPTDLIDPKCQVTNTTPVLRKTRHLFLDLPQLTALLEAYIQRSADAGGWSQNCTAVSSWEVLARSFLTCPGDALVVILGLFKEVCLWDWNWKDAMQITKSWMKTGLNPRCISRDLVWGTPIPYKGFQDKVFYVWFDAPIGYVSITANYVQDWKAWWQNPEEVELVQFMGKDNVPFHTIIFPASQLGSRQKWTMMRSISVTEYLNYEGGKFSKTLGRGVFGDAARDTDIPPEVWRYYLLSNRPEVSDTEFKWSDFSSRLNNELLANLGNFVNRALAFTASKFGGLVPPGRAEGEPLCAPVLAAVTELSGGVAELSEAYVSAMEAIKLRDGIKIAMAVSGRANKFLQDMQPWELLKQGAAGRQAAGLVVKAALGLVLLLAALVEPYMPSTAARILEQLNWPADAARLTPSFLEASQQLLEIIPENHKIGTPQVLFQRIDPQFEAELRQKFNGTQEVTTSTGAVANSKVDPKSKDKGSNTPKVKEAKVAPAKSATPKDVSAIDLRVGIIKNARLHEKAENLYVEDVDCGEAEPRQVVSGLVKHISLADMQNRRVVIVANLKAGNMRGIKSQAMVLAAASADGQQVELVEPPEGSLPGEQVTVQGYPVAPVHNLKKDAFDPIASGFQTNLNLVACYRGVELCTSKGPCRVKSLAQAGIK